MEQCRAPEKEIADSSPAVPNMFVVCNVFTKHIFTFIFITTVFRIKEITLHVTVTAYPLLLTVSRTVTTKLISFVVAVLHVTVWSLLSHCALGTDGIGILLWMSLFYL